MMNLRLVLLATAAALSLQACDVQVHSGDTKVKQPQATLPEDTQLHSSAATTTTAPAPADSSVAPAPVAETTAQAPAAEALAAPPTPASETTAQAPMQPDTATLGATSAPPTAAATTGAAAPTELQRFFEQNAPAAKQAKAAAKK